MLYFHMTKNHGLIIRRLLPLCLFEFALISSPLLPCDDLIDIDGRFGICSL
jgi:hypothetical protein